MPIMTEHQAFLQSFVFKIALDRTLSAFLKFIHFFQDHIRSRYAWIGVTDKDREGQYQNMDGSPVNFNSYARVNSIANKQTKMKRFKCFNGRS